MKFWKFNACENKSPEGKYCIFFFLMCIFRQECWCNIHSNWAAEKDFKVYDINCGKKFKKTILHCMIQNNYLGKIVITFVLHVLNMQKV